MFSFPRFSVGLILISTIACVPQREEPVGGLLLDAGTNHEDDVGSTPADAGPKPVDAGSSDAGSDAGHLPDASDTGTQPVDSGQAIDGGGPRDSGVVFDGSVPITGARAETPDGTRHIYSQVQAWTVDGLYFLTIDVDTSEGVVYHAGTWELKARLSHVGHRWITGTHEVLMFEDRNDAELLAYDVDTGTERTIMGLGHPGLRAGRSQEEMDRSGRWVAVYIDEPTSGVERIVTADIWNQRVAADVSISDIGCGTQPDWVGVDPTGQYLLVQSTADGQGNCRGLWAHNIETGAAAHQLTEHHNHGTTGLGPNSEPYFLSTEISHPNDNGSPGIYRYWIETGTREVVGAPLPWGALQHVSCLDGPGAPCMASATTEYSSSYTGQVWRLAFTGQRTILEPHHADGCDYWGQPHATVGPGGRYAFVTHGGNCSRIRSVVVQ